MKLRRKFTSFLQRMLGEHKFENLRYQYYKLFVPNLGYSKEYYEGIRCANQSYYELFAQVLMEEFKPNTLVDCGCGHGGISREFLNHGCKEAFLFDGSPDAVEIAKSAGMKNVAQLDFISAKQIPATGDLAICLEVAEHIPTAHAPNLCHLLSGAAPTIAFTAAPPGQGGHLHVNNQPQSYWIDLFAKNGMIYDAQTVARIREKFAGRMLSDYDQNLMVFRKKD
jgi:hypothetical protein